MKFEDYPLSPTLKKNIALQGLRRPTDIQYKAIPSILKGEDVLAIAQTGTGKTAAFVIPVLNKLDELNSIARPKKGIKCLVLVPTRELAIQITEVFSNFGRGLKLTSLCVFGGVEQDPQIAKLQDGVDILVATPGRMFDLVSQKYILLDKVEILILDEADHMLDLGFIKDIQDVMRFLPEKRQTLFVSATIDEKIKKLAYSLVTNPIRIQISPKDPITKKVHHSVAFIEPDDKRFFLERMVKEHPEDKILVFVRTKVRAERVQKAMERVNIVSQTIHGDKEQKDRLETLKQFKEGTFKVLIATDVSARGIDIPNVNYVINYDLPEQPENYVHRVGRTGRGNQFGTAISFCGTEEKPILQEIEKFINRPVSVLTLDKHDYDDTLTFSDDKKPDWESLKDEMAFFEKKQRKRAKRKI